jgi:hypothetical protein
MDILRHFVPTGLPTMILLRDPQAPLEVHHGLDITTERNLIKRMILALKVNQ